MDSDGFMDDKPAFIRNVICPAITDPACIRNRDPSYPTIVSVLNFILLSFPNIPSCIAISRDPSQLSRNAISNSPPSFTFHPSQSRGLLLHPASLFPAACRIAMTPRLQQLELPLTTMHSCRCSPVGTRPLNVS